MDFKLLRLKLHHNNVNNYFFENGEFKIRHLYQLTDIYDIILVTNLLPLNVLSLNMLVQERKIMDSNYFNFKSFGGHYFVNKKMAEKYEILIIKTKSEFSFNVKTIQGNNIGTMNKNKINIFFESRLPLVVNCDFIIKVMLDNYFSVSYIDCGNMYLVRSKGSRTKAAIK